MASEASLLIRHCGFARYFRNSVAFWMNLQTRYDLEVAEDEIAAKVVRDVQPLEERHRS
jgi:plasmid maintenance system antidote protein VapI